MKLIGLTSRANTTACLFDCAIMLPNLSLLTQTKTKRPSVIEFLNFVKGMEGMESMEDLLQGRLEIDQMHSEITSYAALTRSDVMILAQHINERGKKILTDWLLTNYPDSISIDGLYRHCTREWWHRRTTSLHSRLNLHREDNGDVIVDLWHARRGIKGENTFKDFVRGRATFFMGSLGEMTENYESVEDYVGESDEPGNIDIYVKRGRFRFKPLLWFDDKDVIKLREDFGRADVIVSLVKQHPNAINDDNFNMGLMTDEQWKRILYYRTESIQVEENKRMKFALELRLDNNCVDSGSLALEKGFGGTLAVDVSGFQAAMLSPGKIGIGAIETESVVLWDPAASVIEEGPWVLLSN